VTPSDDDLVQQGKPPDDAVASVLKAKVLQGVLGGEAAAMVGRFRVLDVVGRGANGVVYAAYDPTLDRRVAVKVLSQPDAEARSSLLHEARTLAKLHHPNVVSVHEAGTIGDDVFIAMQFVGGGTLRTWLEDDPPDVLDRMLGAARGLAAAHAAGIAHGDFKPDNVLVDSEGTWVADFGLARPTRAQDPDETGGTPLYMAPERLDGGPPTELADQFAFGVTLIEVLTGTRPFKGRTIAALRESMERGPVLESSSPALEVGLRCVRAKPEDRYPDMEAVVEALQPRPAQAPWRGPLVAIGAVLVIGAVFAAMRSSDPCTGGAALAREVVPDAAVEAVKRTVVSRAPNVDAAAVDRVADRLTSYRDAWVVAHRSVCEATRVRATQSDSLHDLRMRCLDRRLGELRALASAAAAVESPPEAARAMAAVDTLAPLSTCDADRVSSRDEPWPEAAEDVAGVRTELAEAWAAYHLARYEHAAARAETLVERAEAIGFGPLTVEALALHGTVRGRTGDLAEAEAILREALVIAGRTASPDLAADVSTQLLRTAMFRGDVDRVTAMAELVRSDLARAGRNEGEVDGIVGEALLHAGRSEPALEAIERALASETRLDRLAILRTNRASAQLALERPGAALADYEEALRLAREHHGDGHPSLGFFEHRVGRGLLAVGETNAAYASLTRTLASQEALFGRDDRAVASILVDLARAEQTRGETAQARAKLERALEIRRAAYGDEHPSVAALRRELEER
jgi:serine/threonine protein kinase